MVRFFCVKMILSQLSNTTINLPIIRRNLWTDIKKKRNKYESINGESLERCSKKNQSKSKFTYMMTRSFTLYFIFIYIIIYDTIRFKYFLMYMAIQLSLQSRCLRNTQKNQLVGGALNFFFFFKLTIYLKFDKIWFIKTFRYIFKQTATSQWSKYLFVFHSHLFPNNFISLYIIL